MKLLLIAVVFIMFISGCGKNNTTNDTVDGEKDVPVNNGNIDENNKSNNTQKTADTTQPTNTTKITSTKEIERNPKPTKTIIEEENTFTIDSDIVIDDYEQESSVSMWCSDTHKDDFTYSGLSDKHTVNGKSSLKVILAKKQYPGIGLSREQLISKNATDWSGHAVLKFAVFASHKVSLNIRVDDMKSVGFNSRYNNETLVINKGMNYVQLQMSDIGKYIDISDIKLLKLFINKPEEEITFYIDYFAVGQVDPNIEKRSIYTRLNEMPTDAVYKMDIETKHIKWLKPYYAGSIKTLFIPTVNNGRDVIEIAQRLECDYEVVAIAPEAGLNRWGYGDHIQARMEDKFIYWSIAKKLDENPTIEAMVLNRGHGWSNMPENIKQKIMKRVENGMGIVLINPGMSESRANRSDDLLNSFSPLINATQKKVGWKSGKISEHPAVNGIPFDSWATQKNSLWNYKINPETQTEIIVESQNGEPVIAVGKYGSGRVIQFAFDDDGFTPKTIHGYYIIDEVKPYRYWETQYAMVAKAIAWAAKKEPRVSIEININSNKTMTDNTAVVTLSKNINANGSLAISVIDEEENVLLEKTLQYSPDNSHKIDLPKLHYGVNFFNVRYIVEGKVENFASKTINIDRPATILKISGINNDKVYKSNETIELSVEYSGKTESIVAELIDGYERVASRTEINTKSSPSKLKLINSNYMSAVSRIRVSLVNNNITSDRKTTVIYTEYIRDAYSDYRIGISGGAWKYPYHEYLPDIFRSFNVRKLNYSRQEIARGFSIVPHSRLKGVDPRFRNKEGYNYKKWFFDNVAKYKKSNDIKHLVKNPCLSDPEYLIERKEYYHKIASDSLKLSNNSFNIGDENSLTYLTHEFDFCYSEHCLKLFREYLKNEYKTIASLNSSWKRKYKSFDEAMPLPINEAQAEKNYAPWADHKTFMEITFQNTLDFVRNSLREVIPDAKISLSGTQKSTSFNGLDWYRIDNTIDGMAPYSGGSQDYIHASFQKGAISACTGYGQKGAGLFHQIWTRIFLGHTAGQSVFWRYEVLNPDGTFSESGADLRDIFLGIRGSGIGKILSAATINNGGIGIHYSMSSLHAARCLNKEKQFIKNWGNWTKLLSETGYQFRFIAYGEIEDGLLIDDEYKLLVLPKSISLSDKEIKQIKLFIEKGGKVIADDIPGIYNNHCVERNKPAFTDDKITIFGDISNKTETQQEMDIVDNKFRKLMKRISIHPAFNVMSNGKSLTRALLSKYDDGNTSYYGILKDIVGYKREYLADGTEQFIRLSDKVLSESITVKFDRTGYVYNIRTGKYLGNASDIQDTISAAEAKLYAVLPYKVNRIDVEFPKEISVENDVSISMKIDCSTDSPGAHVFNVKVISPDGKHYHHYEKNIHTNNGKAIHEFRFAYNDPKGIWKIRIIDVATSVFSEQSITVKGL